jgi:ATP-dependent DNA helicase DinG
MNEPNVVDLLHAAVNAIGGVERAGQVQMAQAVATALESGEHLLVQAGTGTGKSMAYLVPALAHGERVVVATATLALQRQLVERDLPRIVEALAPVLGRRPTFATLKGRGNYACLHRVYEGPPDEPGALFTPGSLSRIGREVVRVREWAGDTDSGDRDDLHPGVDDRVWAQMSVTSRECLGATHCPYGKECFAERAREQARYADVVVTNHALLAIDAIENAHVLPEHGVLIVDEAHELVSRVTGVATDELTASMIGRAARRAARLANEKAVDALQTAAESISAAVEGESPGRLVRLSENLGWALAGLRDACRAVVTSLGEIRDRNVSDEDAVRRQALAAVETVFATAERMLEDSPFDVMWIERDERLGSTLRVAPLSVSGLLREKLFGDRTVILTSATLKLGGQFDGVARSVGLMPARSRSEGPDDGGNIDQVGTDAPARLGDPVPSGDPDTPGQSAGSVETDIPDVDVPVWRCIDVGSPFDYVRQGILYVARHLPPPGRDGLRPELLTELAELIQAAGGRTLGLFSSMRAARAAVEAMRDRLAHPVLCQGEDSLNELLRSFAADASTCLFGTLSLWQGVDVPGSACQLVVMDRIPFPRPDDPLMAARQQAVDEAGGNGFMAVAASHAALLMAQGAGRLIRSAQDRGVVAVLDSRLATARYASFLRASLPGFWYTGNAQQVRRSLAAIDATAPPPHSMSLSSPSGGLDQGDR